MGEFYFSENVLQTVGVTFNHVNNPMRDALETIHSAKCERKCSRATRKAGSLSHYLFDVARKMQLPRCRNARAPFKIPHVNIVWINNEQHHLKHHHNKVIYFSFFSLFGGSQPTRYRQTFEQAIFVLEFGEWYGLNELPFWFFYLIRYFLVGTFVLH